MKGPDHYREGERLLDLCASLPEGSDRRASVAAEAQAHFLAALVALKAEDKFPDRVSWQKAVEW